MLLWTEPKKQRELGRLGCRHEVVQVVRLRIEAVEPHPG
jgi:hypothetical protein